MNLGEVKNILRFALGRGNSLDDMLTMHIKGAVKMIESRRSWKYMEQEATLTLDVSAPKPNVAVLNEGRIKELLWVRRTVEETGRFIDIPAVLSTQFSRIGAGYPNGFYLLGDRTLVFDTKPDVNLPIEIAYYGWTDIADDDAFEFWLIEHAPLLVVAHTLTLMAALIRNNAVAQLYVSSLQLYDAAAIQADDDLRYGGQSLEVRT